MIVWACAEAQDQDRALETLEAYKTFGATPAPESFNYLLQACTTDFETVCDKHQVVFAALLSHGLRPNFSTLRIMLQHAVEAVDTVAALRVVAWCKEYVIPLDATLAQNLLIQLTGVLDAEGIAAVTEHVIEVRSGLDVRVIWRCVYELGRFGVPIQSLTTLLKKLRE